MRLMTYIQPSDSCRYSIRDFQVWKRNGNIAKMVDAWNCHGKPRPSASFLRGQHPLPHSSCLEGAPLCSSPSSWHPWWGGTSGRSPFSQVALLGPDQDHIKQAAAPQCCVDKGSVGQKDDLLGAAGSPGRSDGIIKENIVRVDVQMIR